MIIPSLYELVDKGIDVQAMLRRLPPEAREKIGASWDFLARPGQRWTPGPEFITDCECGRGFGKNRLGSEALCDASKEPERWGGFAVIGGPDPRQVKRDCLTGPSGLFVAAERRAKAGLSPGIHYINYNDRALRFDSPRGGGDAGLTVYWGASSDPKSFRGPNYGLAWLDEFGVWYHGVRDEQGTNAWQALQPAMRAGPDPKILITQTPSRAPEVRELQRDAERPECPTCQRRFLEASPEGRWRGEPGTEPWRLPPSPRNLVHPLLRTRTTTPVRTCPICHTEVVARVRLVTGSTLDNPHLAAAARSLALRALAGNTAAARAEFDPQGERDAAPQGALIDVNKIERVHIEIPEGHPDRWQAVLDRLGSREVVVFVDPAVTAGQNADDTGLIAACSRYVQGQDGISFQQVVGLQDWTVTPDEVTGAPSTVWAPRALWLALLWGASRIVVEINQGGEEVLASVRSAVLALPSEEIILDRLQQELGRAAQVRGQASLLPTARRMRFKANTLRVESVYRRSPKPARFGWYGEGASRKEQALLEVDWLDGARHWSPCLAQAGAYEPPQPGQKKSAEKKDRFDALVAAGQVLLGVREAKGGIVQDPRGQGWMSNPGAVW